MIVWPIAIKAQEAPLSVIDWLDQLNVTPAEPPRLAEPREPAVAEAVQVPEIEVLPLEAGTRRAGLVPATVTGLPADMWRGASGTALAAAFERLGVPSLAASQALSYALALTEALPPEDKPAAFQSARIDLLMRMGARDPALALVQELGPTRDKGIFARYIDLSLLSDDMDTACKALGGAPDLSPGKAEEVFCSARLGDWETAVLVYGVAETLGLMSPEEGDALARFLDPDLFETEAPLPAPDTADALLFVVHDALGQRPTTARWPRIYANADLTARAGWKTRLEAIERLARTGAVSDNQLLDIYTEREPAASGGIWDRVDAIQRFETALRSGNPEAVSKTLGPAWDKANEAGIQVRFAALFAEALGPLVLSGRAADAAFEVLMLSPIYEQTPRIFPQRAREHPLVSAVAVGDVTGLVGADAMESAIITGFGEAALGLALRQRGPSLGLDILDTLARLEAGAAGDANSLSGALSTLRALGLEDTARRAALQILVARGAS